ncbi:MAG: type II toxin-antitoxin system VapC family toxin [Rhodospirillales bacterium]|nr:MAG: type II toxin-antitoxin system VapC family toxin [Rhodospirillales bacterium]
MILLDTNVLSALMRREADPVVVAWLDAQPPESIWTTAITVFEIRFGLEILAKGRKRKALEEAFASALAEDFDGRILAFDQAAADAAATIAARQREAGRTVEIRDVQIAGIAVARKATVTTRNTRHFAGTGITLIDPWAG